MRKRMRLQGGALAPNHGSQASAPKLGGYGPVHTASHKRSTTSRRCGFHAASECRSDTETLNHKRDHRVSSPWTTSSWIPT